MFRRWFSSWLVCILLFSTASLAGAQTGTGLISGGVADRYGKGLPKMSVRASNLDDGLVVESITDKNGSYLIDQLTPGTYEVQASLGKQGVQTRKVKLEAGQKLRVDFAFEVKDPDIVDPTYRPEPPSLL